MANILPYNFKNRNKKHEKSKNRLFDRGIRIEKFIF